MGNQKEGVLIVKEEVFHEVAQQLGEELSSKRPDSFQFA